MSQPLPFKTDKKLEGETQQLQDKLREFTAQLTNPILRGTELEVEFDTSATSPIKPLAQSVPHGLQRVPQGWIVISIRPKNGSASIFEAAGTDDRNLALVATDDCFADLWVF